MSDRWKNLRAENIGGSEVAALFGESSFGLTYYKLWHIKRGFIQPDNLDDVERVQAGKFMEQGALLWANHRYGSNFYQPFEYVRHPSIKGMACTPDAYDRDAGIAAQVKVVDFMQFKRHWEADGETITKAPLSILLQVQHELECLRMPQNHLIVVVGGNKLYRMICPRDEDVGRICRDAVEKFWAMDDPPEPDFKNDKETIDDLRKSLPSKDFEDFSHDKHFKKLCKKAMVETLKRNISQDALDAINAEIVHMIGGAENVKCGELVLSLPKNRKTPKITTKEKIL